MATVGEGLVAEGAVVDIIGIVPAAVLLVHEIEVFLERGDLVLHGQQDARVQGAEAAQDEESLVGRHPTREDAVPAVLARVRPCLLGREVGVGPDPLGGDERVRRTRTRRVYTVSVPKVKGR